MGKDAISQPKSKETPANSDSVSGSPLILIIAVISIIAVVVYLFKDKIFKKKIDEKKTFSDIKTETPKEEPKEEPKILEGEEKEKVESKFADLD